MRAMNKTRIGTAALTMTLGLMIGSAHAAPIQVDMGSSDDGGTQDVQAGFTEWSIPGNNSGATALGSAGPLLIESDFADGTYTSNGNPAVRFFLNSATGVNLDSRNNTVTGTSLDDLVEDFIFADDSKVDMKIVMQGFKAGTYTMTTYHEETANDSGATGKEYELLLDDANGTGQSIDSFSDDTTDITSSTFDFTSNGTDDVVVTVSPQQIAITNGFTIVPEPASLTLVLGGFGALALRRRRRA